MQVSDEQKRLKTLRKTIKGKLTRFSSFLNALQIRDGDDVILLESRLDQIISILTEFNDVQEKLKYVLEQDKSSNEVENEIERSEFESKYFELIAKAKSLIAKYHNVNASPPIMSQNIVSHSVPVIPQSSKLNIKLPDLKLIDFHGVYGEWAQFHDTFKALIHENSELSNIQKFYYLVSVLKGDAARVVASLHITDTNYNIAWNLLRERFENKKVIINAHIRSIMEFPALTKESHGKIREFLDSFLKNYRALENLGEDVKSWSTLLIYVLVSKLDLSSRKEWEMYIKEKQGLQVADFIKFANERCNLLESTDFKQLNAVAKKNHEIKAFQSSEGSSLICPLCKATHLLRSCDQFRIFSVNERYAKAKDLKVCTNCLRLGHKVSFCRFGGCQICKQKHSFLLHKPTQDQNNVVSTSGKVKTPISDQSKNEIQNDFISTSYSSKGTESRVLLSTACVSILNSEGTPITCRALLDSGSQANFITENLIKRLGLRPHKIQLPVIGISQIFFNVSQKITIEIKSIYNNYNTKLPFLVIKTICDSTPQQSFDMSKLHIPADLKLADPNFNESSSIDLLLGAGLFYDLLCMGQIKLGQNEPILQKTRLGWVVSGNMNHSTNDEVKVLTCVSDGLSQQIERFWIIEDCHDLGNRRLSSEENECENIFVTTTTRNENGRFVVQLPLRSNIIQLKNNEEHAKKRFLGLERKLLRNPPLYREYKNFMQEYESLGHMTQIDKSSKEDQVRTFYLPHHGVERIDSVTTKLRVVFDASSRYGSNLSLNDVLKIGPVVQQDLFSLILRFRKHKFVLVGDIAKMYRQILVEKGQRDLQRIILRSDPGKEIGHYILNTVTYGTSSASFLATRCLKQIAFDNIDMFPTESKMISNDFYMDDLLTGSESEESLLRIRKNISEILVKYGFEIRKFNSNSGLLIEELCKNETCPNYVISDDKNTKTLGIEWSAHFDEFIYTSLVDPIACQPVTKRNILSYISKLFDPMGLLSPIIVRSKLIIQCLWQLKVHWDESIPINVHQEWLEIHQQLSEINKFSIPRHVLIENPKKIQLHGFSDSSEKAYGACLYVVSVNGNGEVESHLLCAKSRVAPLKKVSLPRLELCRALLLSRLVYKVSKILDLSIDETFYYIDSTIVLSWLSRQPNTLKTFVANRTSEILQLTDQYDWYHTPSYLNPADIVSRGVASKELILSELWWRGPTFIKHMKDRELPISDITHITNYAGASNELPDIKCFIAVPGESNSLPIFERISDYLRLLRVMAYCLRFINNARSNLRGESMYPRED